MTRRSYTVWTCDRCGTEQRVDQEPGGVLGPIFELPRGWRNHEYQNLCPGCYGHLRGLLRDFFRGAR